MTDGGSVRGKAIIVLGASSPHGAATVRTLARGGANLALGGRDREKLEALRDEARASGAEALVVGTHLAKRHHPAHLVEAAVEAFGGVDALLYMASACAPPLESFDVEAWERSLEVNLRGFVYCLAAALPAMRDGGCVVVAGVGDRGRDPLLRASRAAARALLDELFSGGVAAAEVELDDLAPEEASRKVTDALGDLARAGGARGESGSDPVATLRDGRGRSAGAGDGDKGRRGGS